MQTQKNSPWAGGDAAEAKRRKDMEEAARALPRSLREGPQSFTFSETAQIISMAHAAMAGTMSCLVSEEAAIRGLDNYLKDFRQACLKNRRQAAEHLSLAEKGGLP